MSTLDITRKKKISWRDAEAIARENNVSESSIKNILLNRIKDGAIELDLIDSTDCIVEEVYRHPDRAKDLAYLERLNDTFYGWYGKNIFLAKYFDVIHDYINNKIAAATGITKELAIIYDPVMLSYPNPPDYHIIPKAVLDKQPLVIRITQILYDFYGSDKALFAADENMFNLKDNYDRIHDFTARFQQGIHDKDSYLAFWKENYRKEYGNPIFDHDVIVTYLSSIGVYVRERMLAEALRQGRTVALVYSHTNVYRFTCLLEMHRALLKPYVKSVHFPLVSESLYVQLWMKYMNQGVITSALVFENYVKKYLGFLYYVVFFYNTSAFETNFKKLYEIKLFDTSGGKIDDYPELELDWSRCPPSKAVQQIEEIFRRQGPDMLTERIVYICNNLCGIVKDIFQYHTNFQPYQWNYKKSVADNERARYNQYSAYRNENERIFNELCSELEYKNMRRGQVFLLLGPPSSGKTTFAKKMGLFSLNIDNIALRFRQLELEKKEVTKLLDKYQLNDPLFYNSNKKNVLYESFRVYLNDKVYVKYISIARVVFGKMIHFALRNKLDIAIEIVGKTTARITSVLDLIQEARIRPKLILFHTKFSRQYLASYIRYLTEDRFMPRHMLANYSIVYNTALELFHSPKYRSLDFQLIENKKFGQEIAVIQRVNGVTSCDLTKMEFDSSEDKTVFNGYCQSDKIGAYESSVYVVLFLVLLLILYCFRQLFLAKEEYLAEDIAFLQIIT